MYKIGVSLLTDDEIVLFVFLISTDSADFEPFLFALSAGRTEVGAATLLPGGLLC